MKVTAIVPTRNRPESLRRLVRSLKGSHVLREIVVIDDASTPPISIDGKRIITLRNEEAALPAAARNQGTGSSTGNVLLFIDDDCIVAPDCLERLIEAFESEDKLGIGGPLIAHWSAPQIIWSAGAERTRWLGRTRFPYRGMDRSAVRIPSEDRSSFPSAFAIRRDVMEAVGGFDAVRFPFHMEEEDLAERVRQSGYAVKLVPRSVVWHDVGRQDSLKRRLHLTTSGAYFVARGRTIFIRRHAPSLFTRTVRMAFWLGLLVPVYLGTLILGSEPLQTRLRAAHLFLKGIRAGLTK